MLDEPRPYLSVARALTYYEGSEKRYLISTPWEQGLPGRLTVCTREEIVDGMLGVGTGTVQRIKAEMSA
jgi:hypothetical protein